MREYLSDYKAIDFFCGGGGMTCGLRMAGINVIAGVDFDIQCKETYEINNQGSKFIHKDIRELSINYFEKELSINKNDDKLIFVGCSPCQFYSIINTSKEKSKESKNLLLDFRQFIEYYNPGYVLVENVPGITTNKESVLYEFLHFLEIHGYKSKHNIIDMSYYGVPQSRKRFSLIASRVNENIKLPEPDTKQSLLKDFIGEKNGFYKIPAGHVDNSEFHHTAARLKPVCIERLSFTPKDGGNRSAWKDKPHLQLKCFINKDNKFKDTFGRMWWNRPAPTITTKFFSLSNGRFAHPDEDRALSLREGATLQTFPKNYVFKTASVATTARLIGNAVPPEYARRLGEVIIKPKGT
ncbi:MAG: DNA cytosine methyltransferase [Campylobacteraceae bacterium]|jgi:DNA (cytosine-5)-methyltransferase 1|nr:DNA cytosine methyltransferase [Campylobacteraceae bacterium]